MTLPLLDALTIMYPTPLQTAYFQACVFREDALARAWPGPFAAPGALIAFLGSEGREFRGHLPLLYRNLTSQGAAIPRALQPYLRAAVSRAERRWVQFERCFDEAMTVLMDAQVDATVVKGAALAKTVFPAPFLRHCHDVDLWVEPADAVRASKRLQAEGWIERSNRRGTVCLEHPAGLPLLFHADLLSVPGNAFASDGLRQRRQLIDSGAGPWKSLAPPDALAHVLGHAVTRGRRPHANWVVDAHQLSGRMGGADWDTFADDIDRAGVALPVLVLLTYLSDAQRTPIPPALMDRLERTARDAGGPQLLAAIDGARFGRPGGLAAMLGRAGWRSRWTMGHTLLMRRLRATRSPAYTRPSELT